MMNKRNTILLALLVAQLAIIGFIARPGRNPLPAETVLFEGLQTAEVTRFVITDDGEKSLQVNRDKGPWQVSLGEGVMYDADTDKIEAFLEKIQGLKSSRLVTRTAGGHDRLKVGETKYSRRIELTLKNGKQLVVFLGSAPNYKSIHVRRGGEDPVYLVKDFSAWEAAADGSAWWQSRYLSVVPDQLREVTITNGQGKLNLLRGEEGDSWHLADQLETPLAKESLNTFLENVSQVSLSAVVLEEKDRPTGEPLAEMTLKTVDHRVSIQIWDRPDEKSDYFAKSSDSEFYVRVGPYAVGDILSGNAAKLIEKEKEGKEKES
ncbi:MAG: DUF4340 domain-containing protein [Proteobacteria bacterium]|nr:DUF4340 domain-containing protein [Pseudomonadota bacterium]MBU1688487.1 DUF4340 domain-containing protein [Pseudomonadota bacterium]